MNSCTRLAAVMVLGLPVAAGAADAPKPLPVPVEVATARLQAVTPRTWIPGSIVSRDDARVASVVAGRVIAIAEVGQRVGAGARLAKLDDTLLKLRLADLEAQVARARAQQNLSTTQLERFRQLAATHALSTSQLDDARAQQDMAGHDVARLTAQLKQAEYDSAESEIRAPFPGIVTERFAQRGEFLQAGAPVVRLVNASDTEARATAALVLAANVRPGQQVAVRARGEERHGTVRTVVPVGDDRSRQFEVRVAVASGDWLVGTPIDISVPTAVERQAITVPRDALVIRQNRSYVLRVTPADTVEELEVTPGDALVDVVEVRGLVSAGDRLVVRGAEHLSAGQRVTIVPTAAHSSAARVGRPG
jgi:RND family efflux transporter MFP subunit